MDHPHQLEFFSEQSELEILHAEMALMRKEFDKFRKTMLQRHNELCKLCLLLEEENASLVKKLSLLEKNFGDAGAKGADGDYLQRLFAEAYLAS